MNKIISTLVRLCAVLTLAPAFLSADRASASPQRQTIFYSQNFDTGSAPEWNLEQGWEIAPSQGGYALKGTGHVWARLNKGPWSDYSLRFRVMIDGNTAALHANVMLLEAARYFIGLNHGNLYLSKQTTPNQFFNNLAGAGGLGSGWHTVEIGATGGKVTVSVDQEQVMKYTDSKPLESGGIGFESLDDGTVWVDDVEVREIALTQASPAPGATLTCPPETGPV